MTNLIEILLIVSGVDKTKGDLDKAQSYLKETGAALILLGTQFEKLGAPIREALGDGIHAAADLQEAMSLTGVVFGDNADDITAWSESVRGELLLTQSELRQWVSRFTILFHQAGMSMDDATVAAQDLIVRSTDLALAWNTPGGVVGALEKIEAGLTTTIRPLREFGVFIDMSTVKAYALANGISIASQDMLEMEDASNKMIRAQSDYNEVLLEYGENTLEAREALTKVKKTQEDYYDAIEGSFDQLTQGEKVLSRYGLTMEATSSLANFAVVEQNNWKYAVQELSAVWEDFLAFALMPVLDMAVPFIKFIVEMVKGFQSLPHWVDMGALAFFGLIAVLGPILIIVGGLLLAIGALSTALIPLGLTVGGVALAVAGFVTAVGLGVGAVFKYKEEILDFIEKVRPLVEEGIASLITFLEDEYTEFQSNVDEYNTLWRLAQEGNWKKFEQKLAPMIKQFWINAQEDAETFFEWVLKRQKTFDTEYQLTWEGFLASVHHTSQNQLGIAQEDWNRLFEAIVFGVQLTANIVVITLDETFKWLWTTIDTWLTDLSARYVEYTKEFAENLDKWRKDTKEKIAKWIEDTVQAFKDQDWTELGKLIVGGFVRGIGDHAYQAIKAAYDLAEQIKAIIGWVFQYSSPSKVMMEIGRSIPEGLAVGIRQRSGEATFAAARMATGAGREVVNNYYLNANYAYQSPTSLMDDVRMIQLLRGS